MAQTTIDVGAFVDDPSAESIRDAFTAVNAMTLELFTELALGSRQVIDLSAEPDTIRGAFVKANTNLAALYTEQSLPSVPVIDVGDAPDDPVPTAETIYAAFTKINTAMTALYESLEEPPPEPEGPAVAFPGAMGFGAEQRHAYDGSSSPTIIRVNTLADPTTMAALVTNGDGTKSGSFRSACMFTGPRVIVFEVGGYIALSSIINVVSPYLYIAGATAPSPGISLRNYALQLRTHHFAVQHLRNRVGTVDNAGSDGFACYSNSQDGIFDHLSVAWAVDGSIDISNGPTSDRRITVQNCIMAEHLRNAGTAHQANHSRAMAIQNQSKHIAVLRNLYAHCGERLPFAKADTSTVIVNNFIYDQFGSIGMYQDDPDALNLPTYASVVGNRWKQGPSSTMLNVTNLQGITIRSGIDAGSKMYRSDNTFEGAKYAAYPYRAEGFDPTVGTPPTQAPITGLTILASTAVPAHVLANAGARPENRDAVDTNVVTQATNGTGRYIDSISQSATGGYPSLSSTSAAFTVPTNPHTVTASGYTNLEVAIHAKNALVEP